MSVILVPQLSGRCAYCRRVKSHCVGVFLCALSSTDLCELDTPALSDLGVFALPFDVFQRKDRPMEGIWSGRGTGLISEIVRFDERLSRWVYFDLLPPSLRGATDRLCMLLEYTGHGVPWILLGLITLFAGNDQQQCLAVQLLVGFVIDLAMVGVLKMATCRPRPPYNSTEMLVTVQLDMKFSFPSGHTTRAVFLALFFMDHLRLSLQVALVVWSVCVACSRVLLGRHHVLDVIAAVPVGVTVIALLQCCQGSVVPLLCRTVSNFI